MKTKLAQDLEELASGKTKVIYQHPVIEEQVYIVAKDDITAGDGAKKDSFEGKGTLSTRTTCNVFRLLKQCDVPVAFHQQIGDSVFSADKCNMIPLEVVVRREAHGSYLKRRPDLEKGHLFPKLVVEFYLKTSGRKWGQTDLPCDDPLLIFPEAYEGNGRIYNPKKPVPGQESIAEVTRSSIFLRLSVEDLHRMATIAGKTFLILEKAWQIAGCKLVDFKVEFGIAEDGMLLLADVIDNDSWRVMSEDAYIDKQVFRDGGEMDLVKTNFEHVARMTDHFSLPDQRVLIWTGSTKDDTVPIEEALSPYAPFVHIHKVVCSMHKEPVRGIKEIQRWSNDYPDSVVIALIGRSNGAGPTLSAATTLPVITIPAGYKCFPEDIWSSLRAPSDTPVMTVLEPSNAVLATLNILQHRNPYLYMVLREKLEERIQNVVPL